MDADALVNKNVSDYALVVGNPGRRIGWICQCGETLPIDLKRSSWGRIYEEMQNGIKLIQGTDQT